MRRANWRANWRASEYIYIYIYMYTIIYIYIYIYIYPRGGRARSAWPTGSRQGSSSGGSLEAALGAPEVGLARHGLTGIQAKSAGVVLPGASKHALLLTEGSCESPLGAHVEGPPWGWRPQRRGAARA